MAIALENKLQLNFISLFDDVEFSDCVVVSADDHEFKLHRLILSKRSDVFKAMLSTNMIEGITRLIKLPEHSKILKILFEVMYGIDSVVDHEDCIELCRVSKKYLVIDIYEECIKGLEKVLAPSNAVATLIFAHEYDLQQLIEKALLYIGSNFKKIRHDKSWDTLTHNKEILTLAIDAHIKSDENRYKRIMMILTGEDDEL